MSWSKISEILQKRSSDIISNKKKLSRSEIGAFLVEPLIEFLGYSLLNVLEVEKGGESDFLRTDKPDYIIFNDMRAEFFIEVREMGESFDVEDIKAIEKSMPDSKIGIITNGVEYKFYSISNWGREVEELGAISIFNDFQKVRPFLEKILKSGTVLLDEPNSNKSLERESIGYFEELEEPENIEDSESEYSSKNDIDQYYKLFENRVRDSGLNFSDQYFQSSKEILRNLIENIAPNEKELNANSFITESIKYYKENIEKTGNNSGSNGQSLQIEADHYTIKYRFLGMAIAGLSAYILYSFLTRQYRMFFDNPSMMPLKMWYIVFVNTIPYVYTLYFGIRFINTDKNSLTKMLFRAGIALILFLASPIAVRFLYF